MKPRLTDAEIVSIYWERDECVVAETARVELPSKTSCHLSG